MRVAQLTTVVSHATSTGSRTCAIVAATTASRDRPVPRTLLGERLNDLVRTTWAEVDVVAVCFPCDEKIGPGDRYLVGELAKVRRRPKIAVATKTDLASPQRIGEHLLAIAELGRETGTDWAEIVPVSASSGE